MIKIKAINNVVIILKDKSEINTTLILPNQESTNMYEIPSPFTGVIDSVGMENEWKKGDRVAFCEMGGLYMKIDDREYVVVSPNMIIGKF